jgi:hypothetical protein
MHTYAVLHYSKRRWTVIRISYSSGPATPTIDVYDLASGFFDNEADALKECRRLVTLTFGV